MTSITSNDLKARNWMTLSIYPIAEVFFLVMACIFAGKNLSLAGLFILLAAVSLSFSIHITFHECVHAGIGIKKSFSPISALMTLLAGVPFDGYRLHHFNHHRFNNSIEDYSTTWRKVKGNLLPRRFLIYGLGWPVSFFKARQALKQERKTGRSSLEVHKKIRTQAMLLLVFSTTFIVAFSKVALIYFMVIYIGWVLTSLHNFLQHPPMSPHLTLTTSIKNRFYNKLFSNNGLHWEHHDNPSAPWSLLKANKLSVPIRKSHKIHFQWDEFDSQLSERQLLGMRAKDFLTNELTGIATTWSRYEWTIQIGKSLLFDRAGLMLLAKALSGYEGQATTLKFYLKPDDQAFDDYYSLQESDSTSKLVLLPIFAVRSVPIARETLSEQNNKTVESTESLEIMLPSIRTEVPFPTSLRAPVLASAPKALLLAFQSDFDLLFANQILLISQLNQRLLRDKAAWVKSLWPRGGTPWKMRVACAHKKIHPTAQIHPTAVIEGSEIKAGARIGAHCVIRFSSIGANVRLHDGAKVELSLVGDNSWLMHDLVLYRSYTEDNVFLIHGPYQFSAFQSKSSAFATIMMDYRPDSKPIRVNTPIGAKLYRGCFLGAVLKPDAKTLGGTLVAPGTIVPSETWLGPSRDSIHRLKEKTKFPIKQSLSAVAVTELSKNSNTTLDS